MNYFWKILLFIFSTALILDRCLCYSSHRSNYRLIDSHKPYEFNDVELTAIQAITAFREVIGELLTKVGFNLPAIASIITRSDMSQLKPPVRIPEPLEDSSVKSAGLGSALLRGMALSLPILIPMATQMRRMSSDAPYLPPIPFMPDPYYNRALHRRRGRRSVLSDVDYYRLKQLENILSQIDSMSRQYDQK